MLFIYLFNYSLFYSFILEVKNRVANQSKNPFVFNDGLPLNNNYELNSSDMNSSQTLPCCVSPDEFAREVNVEHQLFCNHTGESVPTVCALKTFNIKSYPSID